MGVCKLEIRATEWPKWEPQKARHNVIEQTKQKEGEKEGTMNQPGMWVSAL